MATGQHAIRLLDLCQQTGAVALVGRPAFATPELLRSWGVDTSGLTRSNDGDPISGETCRAVADAIEAHLHELSEREQEWLGPHIEACWRCNGCV